jgi:hypothetical protein
LEQDKEALEIEIAKERIERPILSKEEMKCWLDRFRLTPIDEQKLIDVFLKFVYVYNDKMLVVLNYKDGEFCVSFDEIKEMLGKKENPHNHNDYQGSPLNNSGEPSELLRMRGSFCLGSASSWGRHTYVDVRTNPGGTGHTEFKKLNAICNEIIKPTCDSAHKAGL